MFTATTILAVKKDGHTAVAGDGQVTMGNAVIMKNTVPRKSDCRICRFGGGCFCII